MRNILDIVHSVFKTDIDVFRREFRTAAKSYGIYGMDYMVLSVLRYAFIYKRVHT